ncbi:uracil-DNA glycosylase [Acidithrix ferrooxidans]|uniref:uracil-DNA glycosylase n=1 Tax=Acidithrix ferrooxidans TaxID=1280514 RepID=UPI001364C482|nr:uracil-DNA glycosylase [Acidithrix ferrooxidans]
MSSRTDFERTRSAALECQKCSLCESRLNVVFGEGDLSSPILFVGEAPGAQEDLQSRPFVGRSGKLLERLIFEALGLNRGDVYITNVVKCRPPENRLPKPDEVRSCSGYLKDQLNFISPFLVISLGSLATKVFMGRDVQITKCHGEIVQSELALVMPIFHPAYALRRGLVAQDAIRNDLIGAKGYLQEIGVWNFE